MKKAENKRKASGNKERKMEVKSKSECSGYFTWAFGWPKSAQETGFKTYSLKRTCWKNCFLVP